MKTLPPETTTFPYACEPRLATHFTFFVVLRSISSEPGLGLPGSKRSGRPLAAEYMLRPGSFPPQRGQSWAHSGNARRISSTTAQVLILLIIFLIRRHQNIVDVNAHVLWREAKQAGAAVLMGVLVGRFECPGPRLRFPFRPGLGAHHARTVPATSTR